MPSRLMIVSARTGARTGARARVSYVNHHHGNHIPFRAYNSWTRTISSSSSSCLPLSMAQLSTRQLKHLWPSSLPQMQKCKHQVRWKISYNRLEKSMPPITRQTLPKALFDPTFYTQFTDNRCMKCFDGTGQDCVRIVSSFVNVVEKCGAGADASAMRVKKLRDDPRFDPFNLHAVGLIIRDSSLPFWKTAAEVLISMDYAPTIVMEYRRERLMVALPDPPRAYDRLVRAKFDLLLQTCKNANALVIQAIELAMTGTNPKTVIWLVDVAEQVAAAAKKDPLDYSNFEYADDAEILKGKMMWILGKKEEATEYFKKKGLEEHNKGALFWYSKSLAMDDPQKEVLLGVSGIGTMELPVLKENVKLHGWKSARAHERGDKAAARFHSDVGRHWSLMVSIKGVRDRNWLFSEDRLSLPELQTKRRSISRHFIQTG